MRDGLYRICEKILGEEGAVECSLQLEAFRRKEGCFGSHRALTLASRMPAYQWWGAVVCEEEAGELKSVALKVKSVAADIMYQGCQKRHDKHGAMMHEGGECIC